ncbi:MAG TPA: AtpZ/AtpI family protein [Candidatus Paceibacterota bacterium]|nr:AtpZ/AtpI family protein [Candidatus Pacearchaeota archaeon]HRR39344.1 AtpZ/AtpI family protein [Candidatus Paceibacterota bacterium]
MSSPVKNQNKDKSNNFFYAVSLGLEMGFLIALPLVIFLILGVFLDKKFETFPFYLISAMILGLVLTFLDVYYFVLPFLTKKLKK